MLCGGSWANQGVKQVGEGRVTQLVRRITLKVKVVPKLRTSCLLHSTFLDPQFGLGNYSHCECDMILCPLNRL